MISGYISAKVVISKLYRDLGINEEIPESSIYEWMAEALSLIGAYSQYNEVSECLTLSSGKAKLPCDFYKLVTINFNGHPVFWATNTNANNYQCDNCQIPICSNGECKYTFYLNDNYLITNIGLAEETEQNVCIVYLAVPVDEEGFPLVPDDIYYQKALTAFVTYMLDYQEFRKGKMADKVFQYSKSEWEWYVNSARASALMPNLAKLERLKNIWRRLLPLTNEYQNGFVNLGKKENRNIG